MNFIKLDILVLLDQHQKITAVAEALGVKQPTVTFHMKSLEEQYGVPLFEVYGGKYKLTNSGKALLHYARKIRALGLEAGRVMAEQRSPARGSFHIGASYVAGTYLLPAWIHKFCQLYPDVEVKLTIRTAPVIRQMLSERQIDLGFIAAQQTDHADGLRREVICEDRLVAAFSASHPLNELNRLNKLDELDELNKLNELNDLNNSSEVTKLSKVAVKQTKQQHIAAGIGSDSFIAPETATGSNTSITPEQIAAYPFLFHGIESTTRSITEHWVQQHAIQLQHGIELDSLETIKRSLVLGNHVTFISYMAIEEELAAGKLAYAALPGNHEPRMIYACYHPERWISPQMSTFLEIVKEETAS